MEGIKKSDSREGLISRDSQQSLVNDITLILKNDETDLVTMRQISIKEDPQFVMGLPVESILKNEEKRYLLLVERGDFNGVRRLVPKFHFLAKWPILISNSSASCEPTRIRFQLNV